MHGRHHHRGSENSQRHNSHPLPHTAGRSPQPLAPMPTDVASAMNVLQTEVHNQMVLEEARRIVEREVAQKRDLLETVFPELRRAREFREVLPVVLGYAAFILPLLAWGTGVNTGRGGAAKGMPLRTFFAKRMAAKLLG